MRAVRDRIERVAATDFVALIDGESGTGKELVAQADSRDQRAPARAVRAGELRGARRDAARSRALRHRGPHGHRRARAPRQVRVRRRRNVVSRRGRRPVAVGAGQAAARAPGLRGRKGRRPRPPSRQHARRGGDQQEAVRRSSRPACFAPICFTGWRASRSRCRRLRERREDILELASYFLERHGDARRLTLSRAAADALLTYDWPGNVRELERMMERTLALARARHDRSRRSADPHSRRLRRCAAAVDDAQRHAAGLGQPIRQARPRAERAQQAQSVPRARHQLSHAAGVSAICAQAAGEQRAGNITGVFGRELGRTHPAQRTGGSGARQVPCGVMRTSDSSRRRAERRDGGPPEPTATVEGGGVCLEPDA